MENVYAFGIDLIVFIQKSFSGHEDFFMNVNNIADPHFPLLNLFPFISIFDSLFASELLLVVSVGGWLNAVLKWILVEHRPYWWVRETKYYGPVRANKPYLKIGPQTCETGPGCPSGHIMSVASILTLLCIWFMIILTKNKSNESSRYIKVIKYVLWFLSLIVLVIVTIARMIVATHFLHQCLLGVIFGILTTYFVYHYWIYPFVNIDSTEKESDDYKIQLRKNVICNFAIVAVMIVVPFIIYWGQKLFGFDPLWSVKLAFKWCTDPEFLHVNSTPFYALVEATGTTLGWVLCVTPSIKRYRYNTKKRSLLIAGAACLFFHNIFKQWQDSISRDDAAYFYSLNFFAFALRPLFFLRVLPLLSTFGQNIKSQLLIENDCSQDHSENDNENNRKVKTN